MAEPGSSDTPPPPWPYKRAPGQPICNYGTGCYRKNPDHFAQYDHPAEHPLFIQGGAPLAAPPPPSAPRLAFPGGSGDPIDLTLVSDGEEAEETWSMAPSRMAIQNGMSVLNRAAVGPKGVQALRREMTSGCSQVVSCSLPSHHAQMCSSPLPTIRFWFQTISAI